MNIQNRSQSFKLHPKTVAIARNSQPGHQGSLMSLKERPLLDNHKNYYEKNDAPLMSAKVRIQRPQQYLIRSVPTQKQYESEIEKLNQICQQFFLQNEKLKRKINNQNNASEQIWKKKAQWLQSQLAKNKQILDSKNNLISEMMIQAKKFRKGENNFFSQNQASLATQKDYQSVMPKQLLKQLQQRENQMMKYMHKQSQFVQIYVQKQQLEQQVRKYQLMIAPMAKQIQELKRRIQFFTSSESSILKTEQSDKRVEKIKQYNQKLLKMLQVSSCEIERLNNILRVKIQQNQSKSSTLLSQKKEIEQMKQILTECKRAKDLEVCTVNSQLKTNNQMVSEANLNFYKYRSEIQLLSRDNFDLNKRLREQVILNQELRSLVERLTPTQFHDKPALKIEVEVQTEKLFQQIEEKDGKHNLEIENKKSVQFLNINETQQILKKAKYENQLLQKTVKCLQQKVKELILQRQQSSKFIIDQNKQVVNVKKEVRSLLEANSELKMQIDKMERKEKQLCNVFSKINILEQKLQLVTQEYESLLTEVHSSCGETENIQKQLQMMMQQQYSIIEGGSQQNEKESKNYCWSQTHEAKKQNDTLLNLKQNNWDKEFSGEETSIRIMKRQIKSSSQSQLLNKI